jgi:hypothetical protein
MALCGHPISFGQNFFQSNACPKKLPACQLSRLELSLAKFYHWFEVLPGSSKDDDDEIAEMAQFHLRPQNLSAFSSKHHRDLCQSHFWL